MGKKIEQSLNVDDWVLIKKDTASVDSDHPLAFHEDHEGIVRKVYSSGYLLVEVMGYPMLTYDPSSLVKVNKRG